MYGLSGLAGVMWLQLERKRVFGNEKELRVGKRPEECKKKDVKSKQGAMHC